MLHHIRHSTGGSFGELKQTAREMLIGDDGLTKKTKPTDGSSVSGVRQRFPPSRPELSWSEGRFFCKS